MKQVVTVIVATMVSVSVSGSPLTPKARAATVKIYATRQSPNFEEPWLPGSTYSGTGSGVVIDGNRILTSAHVIWYATTVHVRLQGQSERHAARVLFASQERDLAVLALAEADALEGVQPISLGDLPQAGDDVWAFGFPGTGDRISVTKGVLSRVHRSAYLNSRRAFLVLQVDAAINAGNSGGPLADAEGRLVGLTMQSLGGAENTSEGVPAPVVRHFLRDISDGTVDGVPDLGVRWQKIDNPGLKESLGLPSSQEGVLVTAVYPGSAAAGVLDAGDVLSAVGGYAVAGDGSIEFRPGERTEFPWAVQQLQIGDDVSLAYYRDSRVCGATVGLTGSADAGRLVRFPRYDEKPEYFIFGGVAFVPLSYRYLETWQDWWTDAPDAMTLAVHAPTSDTRSEVVVLHKVLAAEVNEGYHDVYYEVVTAVNGQAVRDFRHLIDLVEEPDSKFVRIEYGIGRRLVLDREDALSAGPGILEQYGVVSDRYVSRERR